MATNMVETKEGDVWLSGDGILRFPPGGLRGLRGHDEPLDYATFGRADGLDATECSFGFPNSALTSDGKLWVATPQGLAMLDLPRLPRTNRKPVIYMTGDHSWPERPASRSRAGAATGHASRRAAIRCRRDLLSGKDSSAIPAGQRRFRMARYRPSGPRDLLQHTGWNACVSCAGVQSRRDLGSAGWFTASLSNHTSTKRPGSELARGHHRRPAPGRFLSLAA